MGQSPVVEKVSSGRTYSSPNRILVRSFRISRDQWRDKHHLVQAELEQTRQLAREREVSREKWARDCQRALARAEAAEQLARDRLLQLEAMQARCEQLPGELAAPSPKK